MESTPTPSTSSSKRRRPNFSNEKLVALCFAVTDRQSVITGRLDGQVTAKMKQRAWEEVATAVSLVGERRRQTSEVRKKLADFRTVVKKKAAEAKRHAKTTGRTYFFTTL